MAEPVPDPLVRPGRSPADAIASVDELEASGRFDDAIELATRVNRVRPDPLLERRLVLLRHRAVRGLDTSHAPASWPPPVDDVFPDRHGRLVEIAAEELDLESLASGVLHHGALLVRGLVPSEHVRRLVAGIDRAMDMHDAWRAGEPSDTTAPWFELFETEIGRPLGIKQREFIRPAGSIFAIDSPRIMFDLLAMFEAIGLPSLVRAYLGERPVLSADKLTLRRVPPDMPSTAWHQDGRFLDEGIGIRPINAWVSLSHSGVHAPGLDLLPHRFDHLLETGTRGTPFDWSVADEVVRETADVVGCEVVRPHFEPGDILFFDHLCVHRTGVGPDLTKHRYAVESWFFAPSKYPRDYPPIVV